MRAAAAEKAKQKDHIASILEVYAEMEIGNWKFATPEPDPLSKGGKLKNPTATLALELL